jgi:hypothetical protein
MPSVRAEFGIAADLEANILAARRRGKRFRWAFRYRAASWFRESAREMFRARNKTSVKGEFPSRTRRAKKGISYLYRHESPRFPDPRGEEQALDQAAGRKDLLVEQSWTRGRRAGVPFVAATGIPS